MEIWYSLLLPIAGLEESAQSSPKIPNMWRNILEGYSVSYEAPCTYYFLVRKMWTWHISYISLYLRCPRRSSWILTVHLTLFITQAWLRYWLNIIFCRKSFPGRTSWLKKFLPRCPKGRRWGDLLSQAWMKLKLKSCLKHKNNQKIIFPRMLLLLKPPHFQAKLHLAKQVHFSEVISLLHLISKNSNKFIGERRDIQYQLLKLIKESKLQLFISQFPLAVDLMAILLGRVTRTNNKKGERTCRHLWGGSKDGVGWSPFSYLVQKKKKEVNFSRIFQFFWTKSRKQWRERRLGS